MSYTPLDLSVFLELVCSTMLLDGNEICFNHPFHHYEHSKIRIKHVELFAYVWQTYCFNNLCFFCKLHRRKNTTTISNLHFKNSFTVHSFESLTIFAFVVNQSARLDFTFRVVFLMLLLYSEMLRSFIFNSEILLHITCYFLYKRRWVQKIQFANIFKHVISSHWRQDLL